MRMKGTLMRTTMDDLTERISIVYHARTRDSCGNIVDGEEEVRCMVWARFILMGHVFRRAAWSE